MSHKMKRAHYADMFGPTTGDKVRLGDTSLIAEVEKDFTVYGDECKFGGGKTRSADCQSAVSQVGNLRSAATSRRAIISPTCRLPVGETADCQSALLELP